MAMRDDTTTERRPPAGRWSDRDFRNELDVPGWDDFSEARERFFASLRTAAAAYRGEHDRSDRRERPA